MSDTRCRAGEQRDFFCLFCVLFLIKFSFIYKHLGVYILRLIYAISCCSKIYFSEWLVIYFYFLQSRCAGPNSHTFFPKLLQIAFICISFFISSRSFVVLKNRGLLDPVERNSNPIRLEQCLPPSRLLLPLVLLELLLIVECCIV